MYKTLALGYSNINMTPRLYPYKSASALYWERILNPMSANTTRSETFHARLAIVVAILLQLTLDKSLVVGPKYVIAILEVILVFGVGIASRREHGSPSGLRHRFALILIALVSVANATSMFLVARGLIDGVNISGRALIASAGAIFITNIIIFSLWYWELDSPGLTGVHRHDSAPKFDFPQMESKIPEAQNWEPSYSDYLYMSTTNATAFSPTDTMPFTHSAKLLMGIQSLISLVAVVLVTARAVNIIG